MVAFAPVENPQIAVAVVVEGEEAGDAAGGRTAGPIAGIALKKFFESSVAPKVAENPEGASGRKPPRFSSAASYDKACQNSLSGGYFEPIIFKTPRGEAYFI